MLNKILQRAMGESYSHKLSSNKINLNAESYKDNLYIKNKRIASENMALKGAINGLVDDKRGVVTARGELAGPVEVGKRLDFKKLIQKGYKIKGMSQKEIEDTIADKGVKGVANIVTKFVTDVEIDGLNRAIGNVILDDNKNIKVEYLNKPELLSEKLRALMTRNNEISNAWINVRCVFGMISCISAPLSIPINAILEKLLGTFFIKLGLNVNGFIFRPLRPLTERYIDSVSTLALAKEFLTVVEDLLEQAKGKNDGQVINQMYRMKGILEKYITKEIQRSVILAAKLKKKMSK